MDQSEEEPSGTRRSPAGCRPEWVSGTLPGMIWRAFTEGVRQPWSLGEREVGVLEEMEDPACDPSKLHNTYRQFRVINRLLSGWRALYRLHLRPLRKQGPLHLLDVGFGGGDITLALRRWAERDGWDLRITAIDPDPRALAYVRGLSGTAGIDFRQARTQDLLAREECFDAVVSNHLLHHLEPAELQVFFRETAALSRGLVLHSDIERSVWAHRLFALGASPFFHRSYIVADGLTSIRRSYRLDELQQLVPADWQVRRRIPFHQLALRLP